jgi:hypothetical protein
MADKGGIEMNTAVKLAIEFAKIRMNDRGFKKEPQWSLLVQKSRLLAVRNDYDMAWETGASDASEELTFGDGSRLVIHNPAQSVFAGYADVLND